MDTITPPLSELRRSAVRSMLEQEVYRTTTTDHRRRAPARAALLSAGVLALAGALVVGPLAPGDDGARVMMSPAAAAASVTFTPAGESFIAEITDPDASAAAMTAAFQERGIDITVLLVPATPSLVGTVVMTGTPPGQIIKEVGARPGCITAGGAPCTTAIEVPADFTGQGEIAIGRTPKPGEAIVAEE